MSSAPRSAGTDSVSAFRAELNKLLPRVSVEQIRAQVFEALIDGAPRSIREIAQAVEVDPADVVAALGMPSDTSLDQTLRLRVEPKSPAKPKPTPTAKRARSTRR